jgi:hypothetical protein
LLLLHGTKFENSLNQSEFSGSCSQTTEGSPVINTQTTSDSGITSVDGACDARNLHQGGNFVHVLNGSFGMNENTLVGRDGVRSDEGVFGDTSTESLNFENVTNDLFSFARKIGVDESDVIVAADAVAEGREALFDALDLDGVGERVADVLKFLISGDGRNDQTVLVASDEATDGAGLANGGMNDGNVISELLLEDGVKVLRSTESAEAISVGEFGEDTDIVGRFEAGTESHFFFFLLESFLDVEIFFYIIFNGVQNTFYKVVKENLVYTQTTWSFTTVFRS